MGNTETQAKKILFLCGSENDKTDENTGKITKAMDREGIEYAIKADKVKDSIAVASADRIPDILAPTINEHKPDAIIYFGAYSLVLGSALFNAMDHLRRFSQIVDGRSQLREFYENGDLSKRAPQFTTPRVKSRYVQPYGEENEVFAPMICVPMKDSVSGGAYAFTSVTGQPSVMEPRPAAPVGNFDAAVNAAYRMITEPHTGVRIHIDGGSSKKAAEDIRDTLINKLGIKEAWLDSKGSVYSLIENPVDVFVFDQGARLPNLMVEFERETEFYIGVPQKQGTDFDQLLSDISMCRNGIFLGPGSCENAAILAAQIVSLSIEDSERKELNGRIRQYINKKTAESSYGFKR